MKTDSRSQQQKQEHSILQHSQVFTIRPSIKLYGSPIDYEDSFKFLGLIFDSKLTWRPHISTLKSKGKQMIGLLKSISAIDWGADQKTLLHLYKLYIRSKIDFGSIVYQSASQTTKQLIEPIAVECLRIASGCFKSTPTESLQVITNEMPLEMRREHLTLKYFLKIKSQFSNPAFNSVIPPTDRLLINNKRLPQTVAIRANRIVQEMSIPMNNMCPDFSYRILNILTPTWSLHTPQINNEICEFPKHSTSGQTYLREFDRVVLESYVGYTRLFTDGSKSEAGVGSAAVCEGTVRTASLPKQASIFSAELHAIHLALLIIRDHQEERFVIFTDSLSSIQAIQNGYTANSVCRRLQHEMHDILLTKTLELCWIPSHVGILGNEEADLNAKRASLQAAQPIRLQYTDWYPLLKEKFNEKWMSGWRVKPSKLRDLCDTSVVFTNTHMTRRGEIIMNRLRCGHTNLTHGYLMNSNVREPPPGCPACQDSTLTVHHLMLDCAALQRIRRQCFSIYQRRNNPSFVDIPGPNTKPNEVIIF